MKKKRILILGGIALQVPFIEKVKAMGHYVITCDNKPDNPGHKIADEHHNVSITDKEAVLQLARKLHVDAVVNYGLEAGVEAAAYAQEKMGKPTSPYESVRILSNKKLFREFLKSNGFNTPDFFTCPSRQEAHDKITALHYPVVVKPTDMWGSRGVTKVDSEEELDKALDVAFEKSRGADIIIEEYIEPDGAPIEGNGFAIDGRLTTHAWADVYNDPKAANPILPVCWCYPSARPQEQLKKLDNTLQRLFTLLGMKTNAYNVEARIAKNGDVYLMEVAPRNGGTLHDILSCVSGKDAMKAILFASLGEDCSFMTDEPSKDYWLGYIVHSDTTGTFNGMWFDEAFQKNNLKDYAPCLEEGAHISTYSDTSCTIGPLIACFKTREEMMSVVNNPIEYFHAKVITISVIVCTYNQEKTISRTLDAILSQECDADFEVIIGEDASGDNTRKICEEYLERYPDKVRLMPKAPNKGIVDNYYGCVREAKGEYIMECGGDDEWCQGRMQLCLDAIRKHSDVVQVFTKLYHRKDYTGEITEPENHLFPDGVLKGADVIDGMFHQKSNQRVSYAMTRRKAIIEIMQEYPDFFNGRKYLAEDKQLIVLLATKGNFLSLPDRTYYYTIDNSSITRGTLMKHLRYNMNMLLLSRGLAKAVNYQGSMLPQYLHIIYIMCRISVWRFLIKIFPFLHH